MDHSSAVGRAVPCAPRPQVDSSLRRAGDGAPYLQTVVYPEVSSVR